MVAVLEAVDDTVELCDCDTEVVAEELPVADTDELADIEPVVVPDDDPVLVPDAEFVLDAELVAVVAVALAVLDAEDDPVLLPVFDTLLVAEADSVLVADDVPVVEPEALAVNDTVLDSETDADDVADDDAEDDTVLLAVADTVLDIELDAEFEADVDAVDEAVCDPVEVADEVPVALMVDVTDLLAVLLPVLLPVLVPLDDCDAVMLDVAVLDCVVLGEDTLHPMNVPALYWSMAVLSERMVSAQLVLLNSTRPLLISHAVRPGFSVSPAWYGPLISRTSSFSGAAALAGQSLLLPVKTNKVISWSSTVRVSQLSAPTVPVQTPSISLSAAASCLQ